jgi:hypothetical protein
MTAIKLCFNPKIPEVVFFLSNLFSRNEIRKNKTFRNINDVDTLFTKDRH